MAAGRINANVAINLGAQGDVRLTLTDVDLDEADDRTREFIAELFHVIGYYVNNTAAEPVGP